MAFTLLYKPLVTVTIRHGYHLNDGSTEFDDLGAEDQARKLARFDVFQDLSLVVPRETSQTLSRLGLLVRTLPTGFVIAASCERTPAGALVPKRIPLAGFRLRFALQARARHFTNYTNMDPASPGGAYYLSNRAGIDGGSFPYLALPAPPYAGGTSYPVGSLVRDAQVPPVTYLSPETGAHTAPAPGGPDWVALGAHNYVGAGPRVPITRPVFSVDLTGESLSEAYAVMVAQDGTTFDVGRAEAPAGGTVATLHVGRGPGGERIEVPSGLYEFRLTDVEGGGGAFNRIESVYVDPELNARNVLALVEIFHLPGEGLGDFALYDEGAGHELRQPEYRIEFLNRYTHWRYRFRVDPGEETDLGDLDENFVTQTPRPLTRSFESVAFGEDKLLPNPSVDRIVPEGDRVFSDVHVHINP